MDKRERSNSFTGNQDTLLNLLNGSNSSFRPNSTLASLINNSSSTNPAHSVNSSTSTITRNNSNPTTKLTFNNNNNNNNNSNDSDIFFIDTNSLDNYGISITNDSAMPSSLTSSEIIPRNVLAPVYQVCLI